MLLMYTRKLCTSPISHINERGSRLGKGVCGSYHDDLYTDTNHRPKPDNAFGTNARRTEFHWERLLQAPSKRRRSCVNGLAGWLLFVLTLWYCWEPWPQGVVDADEWASLERGRCHAWKGRSRHTWQIVQIHRIWRSEFHGAKILCGQLLDDLWPWLTVCRFERDSLFCDRCKPSVGTYSSYDIW